MQSGASRRQRWLPRSERPVWRVREWKTSVPIRSKRAPRARELNGHLILRTAVLASARARLVNDDPREAGQLGSQLLPDPFCQHFAGWIFEPCDIVEIAVVQPRRGIPENLCSVHEQLRAGRAIPEACIESPCLRGGMPRSLRCAAESPTAATRQAVNGSMRSRIRFAFIAATRS